MAPGKDGAAVRIPPPFLFIASTALAVAIERYAVALPFPALHNDLRMALAWGLGAVGAVFLFTSLNLFRLTGQNPEPWKPSPSLIRKGLYKYTRNPMYVGFGIAQLAFGIGQRNLWIILFVVLSGFLVLRLAILPEERYLEEKFGDDYRTYKAEVPRWLGF